MAVAPPSTTAESRETLPSEIVALVAKIRREAKAAVAAKDAEIAELTSSTRRLGAIITNLKLQLGKAELDLAKAKGAGTTAKADEAALLRAQLAAAEARATAAAATAERNLHHMNATNQTLTAQIKHWVALAQSAALAPGGIAGRGRDVPGYAGDGVLVGGYPPATAASTEIAALRAQVAAAEERTRVARTETEHLRAQLAATGTETERLRAQLAAVETRATAATAAAATAERNLRRMIATNEALTAQITHVIAQFNEASRRVGGLQEQIARLEREREQQNAVIRSLASAGSSHPYSGAVSAFGGALPPPYAIGTAVPAYPAGLPYSGGLPGHFPGVGYPATGSGASLAAAAGAGEPSSPSSAVLFQPFYRLGTVLVPVSAAGPTDSTLPGSTPTGSVPPSL